MIHWMVYLISQLKFFNNRVVRTCGYIILRSKAKGMFDIELETLLFPKTINEPNRRNVTPNRI